MAKLLFLQTLEYELFGPMYIAAMVRGQHECRLSAGRSADDFAKDIEYFSPDVIGFSVTTGAHQWAARVAAELKARYNIITLFGGPHPTFFPDYLNEPGVDIICRGEGEEATLDLLNAVASGGDITAIPNLHVKKDGRIYRNEIRPLRDDLDFYPFPDRDLYASLGPHFDRSTRMVITSRGCTYNCAFCCQGTLRELYRDKGKFARTRSIGNVIGELAQLKKDGTKTILFNDDIFGLDRKWIYDFLEVYRREIGLEFICLARADLLAADERYAGKLREAGCTSVFFGVETGSETLRNTVLGKNLSNRDIRTAAENLHRAGLRFLTFNMFGLPGETIEDSWETVRLNISLHTDFPWSAMYLPCPCTPLDRYARQHGYLPGNFSPDDLPGSYWSDSCIVTPDIGQMVNMQRFFQTAVLWPWTAPLVRLAVKMPPNPLFKLWFGLVYLYVRWKSEKKSLRGTVLSALRNFKLFW